MKNGNGEKRTVKKSKANQVKPRKNPEKINPFELNLEPLDFDSEINPFELELEPFELNLEPLDFEF